jgi:hypothetical protein
MSDRFATEIIYDLRDGETLTRLIAERDRAIDQRDRALYLCERARATARRYEEELALIRRALSKAHRL